MRPIWTIVLPTLAMVALVWSIVLFGLRIFEQSRTEEGAGPPPAPAATLRGPIGGTLLDPGGDPRRDVVVLLEGEDGTPMGETRTDAAGGFLFPDLPPGRYRVLSAAVGAMGGGEAAASPGNTGVRLLLGFGLSLEGIVVEPGGGAVVSGTVTVLPPGGEGPPATLPRGVEVSRRGEFRIVGLPPGVFLVRFEGPGHEAVEVRAVAGADVVLVTARLGETPGGRKP